MPPAPIGNLDHKALVVAVSRMDVYTAAQLAELGRIPYQVPKHLLKASRICCKTVEIESGHLLSGHPGKCRFPHGRTRKIEFVLEAGALNEHQMVCDFKLLKETMQSLVERFDHALCMNTDDPMYVTLKAAYGNRSSVLKTRTPPAKGSRKSFLTACRAVLASLGCTSSKCACGKRRMPGLSMLNNQPRLAISHTSRRSTAAGALFISTTGRPQIWASVMEAS